MGRSGNAKKKTISSVSGRTRKVALDLNQENEDYNKDEDTANDAPKKQDTRSPESFEEQKERDLLRELAIERAEEISEDRDQANWDGFSDEEKERRVLEAQEIILDEEVARLESAADGRIYRPVSRPADVSAELSRSSVQSNIYDLQGYGQSGVLSDLLLMYDAKASSFTEDQLKLAYETVEKIEKITSNREQRKDLGRIIFSEEGLRVAEEVLREIASGSEGQYISFSIDPSQTASLADEYHCLAIADYLSILRTGKSKQELIAESEFDKHAREERRRRLTERDRREAAEPEIVDEGQWWPSY